MLLRFRCRDGDRAESLSGCGLCDGVDGMDFECCRVGGEPFKASADMRDAAGVCSADTRG